MTRKVFFSTLLAPLALFAGKKQNCKTDTYTKLGLKVTTCQDPAETTVDVNSRFCIGQGKSIAQIRAWMIRDELTELGLYDPAANWNLVENAIKDGCKNFQATVSKYYWNESPNFSNRYIASMYKSVYIVEPIRYTESGLQRNWFGDFPKYVAEGNYYVLTYSKI